MADRMFLDERELKRIGFSEPNIRTLRALTAFVNLVSRTDAIDDDLTSTTVLLLETEARVDDLEDFEADGPYVKEDQGPTWALATGTVARTTFGTYAGQTVSVLYTAAEVQTIDDHVKVLSQRLAAVIADLKGNGALT